MDPHKRSDLVVVIPELIEGLLIERSKGVSGSVPSAWPECAGLYRSDEGIIRLGLVEDTRHLPSDNALHHVPCFIVCKPFGWESVGSISESDKLNVASLIFIIDPKSANHITALYISPGDTPTAERIVRCPVELIGNRHRLFNRISAVVDLHSLQDKKVAVIGLGSGGGLGAVELAKSGVGSFILVDYDRLEVENISRHVCGLSDVGRWKTRAVKDRILQHNPGAAIECHEVDITEDLDLLESIVDSVDLVFVATDSEVSKYLVNEHCVNFQVPAVYGGVYESAFAGEVVLVTPGRGGCYSCVRHNLANTSGTVSSTLLGDYTDNIDTAHEPGLGIDVGFIANIHVKIALSALLNTSGSVFNDPEDQMIIWVNSAKPDDGPLFGTPLTRYFVKVPRVPDCRTCGVLAVYDEPEDLHNE